MRFCETKDRTDPKDRDMAQYRNRKDVVAQHPSAAKIVAVGGGYAVFDTLTDYEIWRNQR